MNIWRGENYEGNSKGIFVRLFKKYSSGMKYKDCLIPNNKEYLIDIKKGILSEKEAIELANKINEETKLIKDKYLKGQDEINQNGINILNKVKYEVLRRKFKEEL